MFAHRFTALCIAAVAFLVGGVAQAAPEDDVKALYEKGVNAYDNDLDFDAARTAFEKALVIIARNSGKVSGPTVAKIKVRAGVLYIAVDKDNAKGLKAFIEALKADPNVTIDPSLSTPEIDRAFKDAKETLGNIGGPTNPTPQGPLLLNHKPPREATTGTPFRIRVELPDGMQATKVVARYRVSGQTKFLDLPLEGLAANAYQANIPSNKLKKGSLEYYISAEDDGGKILGLSGSSDAPHLVQVTGEEVDIEPDNLDPDEDGFVIDDDKCPEVAGEDDGCPSRKPGGKRIFSLLVSGGGIAGTVGGRTDQAQANIEGGFSFPEAIVAPEVAFYATPKLTIGGIALIQMTGNSGVLEVPEPPNVAGGLRVRYFYGKDQGFRPFFAGDGGFGEFVERFPTAFNGQDLNQQDSTHNRGPFVGLGWGFENDFTDSVALMVNVGARGYLVTNPIVPGSPQIPLAQGSLLVGLRFGK